MTAEEHNWAGLTLARQRHFDQAAAEFRRACELKPSFVEAQYNLAKALKDSGRFDEAIDAYQRTLALDAKVSPAWNNLGNLFKHSRRTDEAIYAYQHVLKLEPNNAEAYCNLGAAYQDKGQLDKAIEAYERALALRPQFADAARNLGSALYEAGRVDESIEPFQQALKMRLDFAEAHHGLGAALHDLGRYDEAAEAFQRGLAIRPGDPNCTYSLGLVRLVQSRLEEGFAQYEARLRIVGTDKAVARDFPQRRWDGSDLHGRRILLHSEQGLGDTIQFVRYASLVRERGGHVIVQCPSPLVRLLEGQLGIEQVVASDQVPPPFEVHCPMLSLPYVFKTTQATIPAAVPYLTPDAGRARQFADRIAGQRQIRNTNLEIRNNVEIQTGNDRNAGLGPLNSSNSPWFRVSDFGFRASDPLRVGFVWAGGPEHANDRNRSIRFNDFLKLLDLPNIRFFSLQKGPAADELTSSPIANRKSQIANFSAELSDFADTAALIANLDLVISVDTAVAHLAGALAKPVWVLLPFAPDWRWMLDRRDSPWYPTMTLFRQRRMGEWKEVIQQVVTVLSGLIERQ